MRFTLSWLKEFLDTETNLESLCKRLTDLGVEVEKLVDRSSELEPFITAEITAIRKHPEADKLNLCTVNYGSGSDEIVCGASNVRIGLKVVLAPLGTLIPASNIVIERRKIRGIESVGMLCSAEELGLTAHSDGIIELPLNTKIGEKLLIAYPEISDPLIEVEITPNRSDLLGVYGIARDLAASDMGTLKQLTIPTIKESSKNNINVIVESKDCSLFITRYFANISNSDSDEKTQRLLRAIGETPLSSAVDVTNYMNYSFARPMHVYDADKIVGTLRVKTLGEADEFLGLDGKKHQLQAGDLVICDDDKICSIAGILGGESTKCTEETKNILLESAVFDPITIAKTARRLGLDTRSKYVFERGVDSSFAVPAIDIASEMIMRLCGGEASEKKIVSTSTLDPVKILFDISKVEKIAGISPPHKDILNILKKLGFEASEANGTLEFTAPLWRHDIELVQDLVEEVARIYGFENIQSKEITNISFYQDGMGLRNKMLTEARMVLASSGYNELITWSFMPSNLAKKFGLHEESLLIANPISEDLDIMRQSIVPNLLTAVQKNNARSLDNLSFFEIGPIYGSKFSNLQTEVISAISSGQAVTRSVYKDARNFDFFDAKLSAINLLEIFGIIETDVEFSNEEMPKYYHPGKSASIKIKDQIIGYAGELHPSILMLMKITKPTVALEIFIDKIPKNHKQIIKSSISEYQPVSRDFAFILDKNVHADSILRGIKSLDDHIIRSVKIFDVYEGENLGENKKSIAITVLMQSDYATLAEKDITNLSDSIISYISEKLGGKIRSA